MTSVADDIVQSYFRRWTDIEDRKDEIAEEAKQLAKDAKGEGLNVKAMRAAFTRVRAMAEKGSEIEEFEAEVDLYAAALHRSTFSRTQARDARMHVRTHEAARPAPIRKTPSAPTSSPAPQQESREAADVSLTSSAEACPEPTSSPAVANSGEPTGGGADAQALPSDGPSTGGEVGTASSPPVNARRAEEMARYHNSVADLIGEPEVVAPPRRSLEEIAGSYTPSAVRRVTDDDLEIPAFLRRGDPECIVREVAS